ncbi:MAG: hypothetical protein HY553_10770 [Elusimicrobia bacterium]|nr:hypothetical protein [Elusimicrobiota bacterium]
MRCSIALVTLFAVSRAHAAAVSVQPVAAAAPGASLAAAAAKIAPSFSPSAVPTRPAPAVAPASPGTVLGRLARWTAARVPFGTIADGSRPGGLPLAEAVQAGRGAAAESFELARPEGAPSPKPAPAVETLARPKPAEPASIFSLPVGLGLAASRFMLDGLAALPGGRVLTAPVRLGLDLAEEWVAPWIGTRPRGGPAGADPFQYAKFATYDGWTFIDAEPRFEQRIKLEATRMYTETRGTIRASVAEIRDALRGPWDWWRHGVYERRVVHADGRISYRLWPAGKLGGAGIYVDETMFPPEPLPDGGERIAIELEGHVNGIAYFELHPGPDGSTVVLGRFAGTEIAGLLPRLMGSRRVARNHVLAESGRLDFPFPTGTGLVGLTERLER